MVFIVLMYLNVSNISISTVLKYVLEGLTIKVFVHFRGRRIVLMVNIMLGEVIRNIEM